jgi:hypothetical protein
MNPPTPGHLLVIREMMEEAIRYNVDKIYVLLSSTVDEKNPLACDTTGGEPMDVVKKDILNHLVESYRGSILEKESTNPERMAKIEKLQIVTKCAVGNSFGFIGSVIRDDFSAITDLNIVFIVGEDRADFAQSLETYFSKRDNVKTFDKKILLRVGMEELININKDLENIDVENIPLEQYSASFIRGLVKSQNKSAFRQAYAGYLDDSTITELYDTISKNMNKHQFKKKPKTMSTKKITPTKTKKREREREREREETPEKNAIPSPNANARTRTRTRKRGNGGDKWSTRRRKHLARG